MTGLRTYFSGYSPLKGSKKGLPAAMWSAGSGNFGAKFKWTGLDELIFEGRSAEPVYALIREEAGAPVVELKPAGHLLGLSTHDKIMALQKQHAGAHFAAIGQAGEHWETNYMGAVALSTDNQLRSGGRQVPLRRAGRDGQPDGLQEPHRAGGPGGRQAQAGLRGGEEGQHQRDQGGRLGPAAAHQAGRRRRHLGQLRRAAGLPRRAGRQLPPGRGTTCRRRCSGRTWRRPTRSSRRPATAAGSPATTTSTRGGEDGSRGEFLAKFDYEPLNLLGTNLGIHDAGQAAQLIKLSDNYGMDSITLGVTVSYVLSYNQRHPERRLLNGATFGDFGRIRELVVEAGEGRMPEVGRGSMRLSERTGETSYAYHVKGLELPAYQPETNPGYAWAIAGGHMSMATYGLLTREGKSDLESWVTGITQTKLNIVGFDMIGLCKFFDIGKGIGTQMVVDCLQSECGLTVTIDQIAGAVRRAFLRGLALELRQGYTKAEFTLPAEVFEKPNPHIKLPPTVASPEFFAELSRRVWAVFEPELEGLLPRLE